MQHRDYIERLIQQVAQAIAAALGLTQAGNPEQALKELDAAWSSASGLRRRDIARLDVSSVRAILGAKMEVAVRLLEAEIVVHEARGDPVACEATRRLLAAMRPG